MIELQSVTKEFSTPPAPTRPPRRVIAVEDVTLRIEPGGVWAFVGPNGAGKTTLFGLILGFLHPSAGAVRVGGDAPRRYLRRRGAAYLPDRFRLPGDWTVRSGLRALARMEGLGRREARAAAERALERFGLDDHASKPVGALSRGLLQRVGLAQAFLAPRDLVVLDEPTTGLDPLWRIRLRSMIRELADAGRTVLLASHDLGEVERLADRVVLLDDGRIRDVIEAADASGARARYRLVLESPVPALTEVFPNAAPATDGDDAAYLVDAADAREFSRRLTALLEAGGVLIAAEPVRAPLEARVQRALAGGEDA